MTTLADRYELLERHGGGGMGSVYSALDTRLDRKVAVKVMQDNLASDPRFIERFRREARAAASLSHPNIAAVFDYGEDDGTRFIVMELVDGRDLAELLRAEGPLSPERAGAIAAQIAEALGHAHGSGVVHRDVKPGNVMVDGNDRVKVTDFGIARAAGDSTLTASGVIMGTVHYISPEQAAGKPTTPPSDVYSLGIVLFEMLTGSVPFTADSAVGVAMRHLDEDVPPPSELIPAVPTDLDRVLAKATAKKPEDRYPDGSAFAADLKGVGHATVPAAAPSTAVLAGGATTTAVADRWDARRAGRAVLAVLAGLAIVALGLALFRAAQTSDEAPGRDRGGSQTTDNNEEPTEEASETPEETPSPPVTGFEIPSMLGDNLAEWENVLLLADLTIDEIQVDHPSEPGTILAVEPEEGSVVQPGDTVTLTTSTGNDPDGEDEEDD